MADIVQNHHSQRRSRSPRYPGIALDIAVQRAHALYEQEKRHWAPIDTIQAHWGYNPHTGPAGISISAMKQFGLLEDEGSSQARRARLTQLALEIILAPSSPKDFITRAALNPEIHRDLWEQYEGSLPSDGTLKRMLILGRNFTEAGAQDFISQFRKTVAFARLGEDETGNSAEPSRFRNTKPVTDPIPEVTDTAAERTRADDRQTEIVQGQPQGGYTAHLRLAGGENVWISGEFPITETSWRHMITVLDALKPGLVVPE